ncbi:MAG: hypothetical protein ISS47_04270 [Candidatus Omnitrophica bacterium]|nr:hypothetical protein [Candidatus Omnitrophota bacterium]
MLPEKKGIEKSLRVKKFIKSVDYSRDEIALLLYYKGPEGTNYEISASGRAKENAGRNSVVLNPKKDLFAPEASLINKDWLPDLDSPQTIRIILPNNVHGCKRKNLNNLQLIITKKNKY